MSELEHLEKLMEETWEKYTMALAHQMSFYTCAKYRAEYEELKFKFKQLREKDIAV